MLVLQRTEGQSVVLTVQGEDAFLTGPIVVRVTKLKKGRVTLSFDAPANVRIMRSEISDLPDNSSNGVKVS